jgi:1,4-alpha-glucan branching enzyme
MRGEHGFLNYRELAPLLVDYVEEYGYTHVELLPLSGHPLDESWGYLVSGYYSITSRYGEPKDFQWFVDYMHQRGIGVIIDWVGGHFPKDEHALGLFDGTPLYEHGDPLLGYSPKWKTHIFDYGKQHVQNFLISNLFFWIEAMHVDGIRYDAVSSMIYRDFERQEHEWELNEEGGRENLQGIAFLVQANKLLNEHHPDVLKIAEEAHSFPRVTTSCDEGGLGFNYKWALGWTYDTLSYFHANQSQRQALFDTLLFYFTYEHQENYLLPLSHDEIGRNNQSILSQITSDGEDRLKHYLLLLTIQMIFPGIKLSFMGIEFGMQSSWEIHRSLPWEEKDTNTGKICSETVKALNHLYLRSPALLSSSAIEWGDVDKERSFFAFYKKHEKQTFKCIFNLADQPYLLKSDEGDLVFSSLQMLETNTQNPLQLSPFEIRIVEIHE